jgi:hypothetical protein
MLMQVNITTLNPKTISKKTCNMHYTGQRILFCIKLIIRKNVSSTKNVHNADPVLNDLGPKTKINAQNACPELKLMPTTFVHRNENTFVQTVFWKPG